jgi:uncharacterized protein
MAFSSLDLDITTRCNLECAYCYRGKPGAAPGVDMPADVARRAARWFVTQADTRWLSISFMGGEPLSAPKGIRTIMEYSRPLAWKLGREITFDAATNCTLINENARLLVNAGLSLSLSIDGTPEAHDACRRMRSGAISSPAAFAGARAYAALRGGSFRATVRPETAHLLAESVACLREIAPSIHVEPDLAADWTDEALADLADAWRAAANAYVLALQDGKAFRLDPLEKTVALWRRLHRPESPCGVGRALIACGVDGVFYPCHRVTGMKALAMGDVDAGVDESGRVITALREFDAKYDARPEGGDCASCSAAFVCRGGCPASNYAATGDMRAPSAAFCRIQRIVAAEALRVLYLTSHDDKCRKALDSRTGRQRGAAC